MANFQDVNTASLSFWISGIDFGSCVPCAFQLVFWARFDCNAASLSCDVVVCGEYRVQPTRHSFWALVAISQGIQHWQNYELQLGNVCSVLGSPCYIGYSAMDRIRLVPSIAHAHSMPQFPPVHQQRHPPKLHTYTARLWTAAQTNDYTSWLG